MRLATNITIDNDQPWSIEFYTCRNSLAHERKVLKHEAKPSVSNTFFECVKAIVTV